MALEFLVLALAAAIPASIYNFKPDLELVWRQLVLGFIAVVAVMLAYGLMNSFPQADLIQWLQNTGLFYVFGLIFGLIMNWVLDKNG